ncbi:hypothetical protein OTERR_09010 [Oryzomicrobium terrae]|jgi:hypothetical protein|uniref:Lipoprotein n=1 Tax=Oryzomicrobium terrae TaxID=1735038 RepID=A0A5C1E7W3_9RHOO|nr:hypothetical protein [Oryzomicrobium terrae]QEL64377.1 hypothetical protein OTERR_09010 [Oryzomicrobium terrae]
MPSILLRSPGGRRPGVRAGTLTLCGAALSLVAGCSNLDGTYPSTSSVIPNAKVQLTAAKAYTFEQIALTAGAGAILYLVYDPLAPNWSIQEVRLDDRTYRMALKLKRFHIGGSGEASQIFRRRAEQLRRETGAASYRVLEYTEGVESGTPQAQRVAEGAVELVAGAFPLAEPVSAPTTPRSNFYRD